MSTDKDDSLEKEERSDESSAPCLEVVCLSEDDPVFLEVMEAVRAEAMKVSSSTLPPPIEGKRASIHPVVDVPKALDGQEESQPVPMFRIMFDEENDSIARTPTPPFSLVTVKPENGTVQMTPSPSYSQISPIDFGRAVGVSGPVMLPPARSGDGDSIVAAVVNYCISRDGRVTPLPADPCEASTPEVDLSVSARLNFEQLTEELSSDSDDDKPPVMPEDLDALSPTFIESSASKWVNVRTDDETHSAPTPSVAPRIVLPREMLIEQAAMRGELLEFVEKERALAGNEGSFSGTFGPGVLGTDDLTPVPPPVRVDNPSGADFSYCGSGLFAARFSQTLRVLNDIDDEPTTKPLPPKVVTAPEGGNV